jgi:hypothetical protein
MNTQKLADLAISENGLIFDPLSGHIFTSNAVGVLIINALKAGKGVNDIKTAISDAYDLEGKLIEKDIFDFIGQLINCGLIQETG